MVSQRHLSCEPSLHLIRIMTEKSKKSPKIREYHNGILITSHRAFTNVKRHALANHIDMLAKVELRALKLKKQRECVWT